MIRNNFRQLSYIAAEKKSSFPHDLGLRTDWFKYKICISLEIGIFTFVALSKIWLNKNISGYLFMLDAIIAVKMNIFRWGKKQKQNRQYLFQHCLKSDHTKFKKDNYVYKLPINKI